MSRAAAFWDRWADRYAAQSLAHPDAYAATLERVRAHLSPEARVLEVGCGTGSTAVALAGGVASYLATDLSPRMIAIARARPEAAGLPQLCFRVAEAGRIAAPGDDPGNGGTDPPGGPVDAVLAFSLLHLVDDLPGTLARLRAGLAPGGLLISKTVCLADLGRWLRALVPAMRLVGLAPPGVAFLGRAQLERAIAEAGFEIVETGDYPAARAARFVVARKR